MGNTLDDERNRLLHSMSVPLSFVIVMWTVKIIEVLFHLDLSCLGLMPLKVEGLPGIFFFHFLHGSWKHLLTNTVPLLVLGTCLYYFYRPLATRVWLLLMLSTGLLTWCAWGNTYRSERAHLRPRFLPDAQRLHQTKQKPHRRLFNSGFPLWKPRVGPLS